MFIAGWHSIARADLTEIKADGAGPDRPLPAYGRGKWVYLSKPGPSAEGKCNPLGGTGTGGGGSK